MGLDLGQSKIDEMKESERLNVTVDSVTRKTERWEDTECPYCGFSHPMSQWGKKDSDTDAIFAIVPFPTHDGNACWEHLEQLFLLLDACKSFKLEPEIDLKKVMIGLDNLVRIYVSGPPSVIADLREKWKSSLARWEKNLRKRKLKHNE